MAGNSHKIRQATSLASAQSVVVGHSDKTSQVTSPASAQRCSGWPLLRDKASNKCSLSTRVQSLATHAKLLCQKSSLSTKARWLQHARALDLLGISSHILSLPTYCLTLFPSGKRGFLADSQMFGRARDNTTEHYAPVPYIMPTGPNKNKHQQKGMNELPYSLATAGGHLRTSVLHWLVESAPNLSNSTSKSKTVGIKGGRIKRVERQSKHGRQASSKI